MKIIKVKDYQAMSEAAASTIIKKVQNRPDIRLGLATGGTPKGMYEVLVRDHLQNGTSYERASSFNLDEYIGLDPGHPNSYHYYMNKLLFHHIDLKKERIYIPNGMAADREFECTRYDRLIDSSGGIDLQILGIGENGHIGFNEPGTSFTTGTHVVTLTDSTREVNARYFDSLEEVPSQAMTMGISTIMKSKEILLLISGKKKSGALKRLLEGDVTAEFPASILNQHSHVTVIADEMALSASDIGDAKHD